MSRTTAGGKCCSAHHCGIAEFACFKLFPAKVSDLLFQSNDEAEGGRQVEWSQMSSLQLLGVADTRLLLLLQQRYLSRGVGLRRGDSVHLIYLA